LTALHGGNVAIVLFERFLIALHLGAVLVYRYADYRQQVIVGGMTGRDVN